MTGLTDIDEYAITEMIYEAEDQAIMTFPDLFVKSTVRKDTMTRAEVKRLAELIQFGTRAHYEYLIRQIEAKNEAALVDCLAAFVLDGDGVFEDFASAVDSGLEDARIRAKLNQALAEVGLQLLDKDQQLLAERIRLTYAAHCGDPVLDPVDATIKAVIEEYRQRADQDRGENG